MSRRFQINIRIPQNDRDARPALAKPTGRLTAILQAIMALLVFSVILTIGVAIGTAIAILVAILVGIALAGLLLRAAFDRFRSSTRY
jgi:hypothetical protein